jgi:hypothetical protein
MGSIVSFLGLVAFALLVGMLIGWHLTRSRFILEQWAEQNGFTIVSTERRLFRRGPFLFKTGDNQEVYYVRITNHEGRQKTGYVRCGSFWLGVLSDKAEVRWDDE